MSQAEPTSNRKRRRYPPIAPGERHNRLVAVEFVDVIGVSHKRWRWRCDCGGEIVASVAHVRYGRPKSCGCRKSPGRTTHGHAKLRSPEYHAWKGIRDRCNRPSAKAYKNYGGRGITVCERWDRFENFLADMGPKPSPKHTLERRNNDLGYSPDNCYWATRVEQNQNTRKNRMVFFQGREVTFAEACRLAGVRESTLRRRLQDGWDVERALSAPSPKRYIRMVTFRGRRMRLTEAAKLAGVVYETVVGRLRRGWGLEEALTRPLDPRGTRRF